VAIKVLPPGVAADPDRLARFEREAQVLASLNHPNIAQIYGIEDSGVAPALVMELVDGFTLADRLATGPLALEEALAIARQLATGLEAAHDKGIIHRDLKPANVKVATGGAVKVLDFGLAKAWAVDAVRPDEGTQATVGDSGTRAGMIVGTPAYMSPEQARGKPLDQRVDVWSFGCVLYELLTGRQAFPGETMSDAIAAVLDREPDWTQLPPATPPAVTSLLRRCLEKDLAGRLPDMRSVLAGLDEVLPGHASRVSTRGSAPPRVRGSRRVWLFAALCGVALLAAVVGWSLKTHRGVPGGPDAAVAPIRSVAVVPLENLSGDPGQAYFVDGMSDALTTELGKIGAFDRVISWQSMKRYKNTTKTAGEIAAEVDVDALVEGVVIREGKRVRISPRLVRVRPERQLWANSYDREVREILALHSEVARAISGEVKVALAGAKTTPAPGEVNAEAYDFYLRGKQYLEQITSEPALRAGAQMFERAIALDPDFAGAHAGLARARAWLWLDYYDRSEEGRGAA
jgi:TolB-like protein